MSKRKRTNTNTKKKSKISTAVLALRIKRVISMIIKMKILGEIFSFRLRPILINN
jgi:hypothetical protein